MISYDKKARHLIVSSGEAVTFDIQLRGRINVVRGAAATGKTYMCTLIRTGNHHPDVVDNNKSRAVLSYTAIFILLFFSAAHMSCNAHT